MQIPEPTQAIETRAAIRLTRAERHRPGLARARGFTLLEILVATAVMGTAVAALFSLLSGALGNASRLQAPSRALLLGQSRMNELLASGIESGAGTQLALPLDQKLQGHWDDQYRWEAEATRWNTPPNIPPGQPMLVRIALDVFWKTQPGKPERKLSLETYQLRPEPPRPIQ